MLEYAFFELKINLTKLTFMLGIMGFKLILAFCPTTTEDYGPQIQKVGLASKCKATFRLAIYYQSIQSIKANNQVHTSKTK